MTRVRMSFALLVVLLTALLSPAARAADEAKPRVFIGEMRHDLGNVFEAKNYRYTFAVKNNGDADLRIMDVHPGCGCTAAQFDTVIAPGAEGKITLEIDGARVSGSFEKSASVTTNDEAHPAMTITLAGTIVPYVTVEPSSRVYLRGMYGEAVSAEFTISSPEKAKDFKVLGLASDMDDKITYKVLPGADADAGRYTIRVFKNPNLPVMNTWGTLTVKTNSENAREKVVQVNVTTRGDITVQPSTVNFGSISTSDAGKPLTQQVTVFKLNGDFKIRNIEFSSDAYHAEIAPVQEGKKYNVTVTFKPSDRKQTYMDEMIVTTDDPQEPALRVRLIARSI